MLNILHTPDSDGLDHLLYPDADDGWLALFECRHDYQGYYDRDQTLSLIHI